MSTPLQSVKDRFKSKEKLIEAVEKLTTDELWLPRLSNDRGGNKGLKHVSNSKLLHLHDVFTAVKDKWGSRKSLIDAIVEHEGRNKDESYRNRLDAYPVPRLFDMVKSAESRAGKTTGKKARKAPVTKAKKAKKADKADKADKA